MTTRARSELIFDSVLLTAAVVAQLADVITWRLMLNSKLGQELNPVILGASQADGLAELLKLAVIFWVMAFFVLLDRRSVWGHVALVALLFAGLVGTASNLVTMV